MSPIDPSQDTTSLERLDEVAAARERAETPDGAADDSGVRAPIVVGVSRSSGSPAALRWALAEARLRGLPLVALRAYRVPGTAAGSVRPTPSRVAGSDDPLRDATLEALQADVRKALGAAASEVDTRAARGAKGKVLVDASANATMLVLDAPRRREVRSGPALSAQLTQRAQCPVVVMPGPVRRGAGSLEEG
ncbi:hypothetical protein DEO23_10005 [Brachybacterium endophyticum]|uniref:UspA domain-containing protein n=1 Tax=Brachybacterium endophyticum TaxID=2182385 RepID=A0A2U2RJS4_9MICO|nr:universal stress protein [Brachybacterium endophyticum]PWH06129.1 hypothetical protein DEO23_10005 [Brachybacterium endophyticum]